MFREELKNYSCTKEFNCIVRAPVPTKEYSWFSNKDLLPSGESYFQPSSRKTTNSHEILPVDTVVQKRSEESRQKVNVNDIRGTHLL